METYLIARIASRNALALISDGGWYNSSNVFSAPYACISGFPRGATPGDPGGFVKNPKQSIFNSLGYGAGKSDQIPPPPGTKRG